MKNCDLQINYDSIRDRIEVEKSAYKPGTWAKKVGVSPNVVSNIHGKTAQKPSMEYIIAVSKATGKSIDYFVWGKESVNQGDEAEKVIINFKDPETGYKNIEYLLGIEQASEELYKEVSIYLKATYNAVQIMKNEERKKTS